MATHTSPAVTFMLKFSAPRSSYVDYTNRESAVENDLDQPVSDAIEETGIDEALLQQIQEVLPETEMNFGRYIDYMNREYATQAYEQGAVTPLFNSEYYHAPTAVIQDLKHKLDEAYDNGSVMWQGVVSFDNDFLAKQGLYNKETSVVDQQAIKTAIRDIMPAMLKSEGLSDSAFWWGDIHLNTDNVHVHIGISEVQSARRLITVGSDTLPQRKGKFTQQTIRNVKSKVFHHLLDDQTKDRLKRKEVQIANTRHELFDGLREELKREARLADTHDRQQFFLNQIQGHLPDRSRIRYGSNAKDFKVSKFFLDRYVDAYLQEQGEATYHSLQKQNRSFLNEYEGAYHARGQGEDGKLKSNAALIAGNSTAKALTTRDREVRERLANQVLKYLKEHPFELESNVATFSEKNQKLIREADPEAVEVRSPSYWQSIGREPASKEQPIMLYQPVKAGEKLKFELRPFYSARQTQPATKRLPRRVRVEELLYMNADELRTLVNTSKQADSDAHNGSRTELGVFRYAYRQRLLKDDHAELVAQSKVINLIQPIESDEAFVSLMVNENRELRELNELQQQSKRTRTAQDGVTLKQLAVKYQDPIQLKVTDATSERTDSMLRRLKANLNAAGQVHNPTVFSTMFGERLDQRKYLDLVSTQIKIVNLKRGIYGRDQKLSSQDDDTLGHQRQLRKSNGEAFNELKQLYAKVQGKPLPRKPTSEVGVERQTNPQVQRAVQRNGTIYRQHAKQASRSVQSSPNLLSSLSRALKAGNQDELRATKAREREEEPEEEQRRDGRSR